MPARTLGGVGVWLAAPLTIVPVYAYRGAGIGHIVAAGAAGGAGPLHVGALEEELDLPLVLLRRLASGFCGLGGLLSDLRYEGSTSLVTALARLDLVESVPPVQLAIRLLIPAGSRLLELPEVRALAGPFDEQALTWRWQHPDPPVDQLQRDLEGMIARLAKSGAARREIFSEVWKHLRKTQEDLLFHEKRGTRNEEPEPLPPIPAAAARCTVPYLTEPWYC